MHQEEHDLIETIYETALDPGLWPITLYGIAAILNNAEQDTDLSDHFILGDFSFDSTANSRLLTDAGHQQDMLSRAHDSQSSVRLDGNELSQHAVFEMIKPHLRRALRLRIKQQQLESRNTVLSNLVDKMPIGIVILDEQRKILFSNTVADSTFNDRAFTVNQDNTFVLKEIKYDHRLKRAVKQIVSSNSPDNVESMQIPSGDNGYYSLLISAIEMKEFSAMSMHKSVIVFLTPPMQNKSLSAELLKENFGLTRSEIKLVNGLVQGKSLDAIAEDRCVSINTLRSQLKSVFEKTQTQRQTELVCRLLTSPAAMTCEKPAQPSTPRRLKKHIKPYSEIGSTITLADGRLMGYMTYGNKNGLPLVFCHSCYGCRLATPYQYEYLLEKGIRLIIPDRPGVGLSDPHTYEYFSDWASDLAQLMDHLKIGEFVIAGKNTGGNFALAAAYALGTRIRQVSLVSPTPPVTSLAQTRDYSPAHKFPLCLALTVPSIAVQLYSIIYKGAAANPQRFIADVLAADEHEKQIMREDYFQEFARKCYPEAAKRGVRGMAAEIRYQVKPWNFQLEQIHQPVTIWRGLLDKHVPEYAVDELAGRLPNATVHKVDGHGHTLMTSHWQTVLAQFIESAHSLRLRRIA